MVFAERREHHHAHIRVGLQHPARGREPAAHVAVQLQVHDHDIGLAAVGHAHRRLDVGGLSDDGDADLGIENGLDAGPGCRVVIDHQHTDFGCLRHKAGIIARRSAWRQKSVRRPTCSIG
jgi:hypothetical protein